MIFAEIFR